MVFAVVAAVVAEVVAALLGITGPPPVWIVFIRRAMSMAITGVIVPDAAQGVVFVIAMTAGLLVANRHPRAGERGDPAMAMAACGIAMHAVEFCSPLELACFMSMLAGWLTPVATGVCPIWAAAEYERAVGGIVTSAAMRDGDAMTADVAATSVVATSGGVAMLASVCELLLRGIWACDGVIAAGAWCPLGTRPAAVPGRAGPPILAPARQRVRSPRPGEGSCG